MNFRTSGLATSHCYYMIGPYEIGYFRDSEWAKTPAQMLDELLVRTSRELGYCPDLAGRRLRNFQLQATIVELLQDHTVMPPGAHSNS